MQISPRTFLLGTLFAGLFSATGYLAAAHTLSAQAESSTALSELVADRQGSPPLYLIAEAGEQRGNSDQFFEQLGLSQSQLDSIRTIRQDARTTLQPLRDQVRTNRQEIRDLMSSSAPASELRQKYETLANLEQQLRAQRFETMLQIREILTPEQRAELGSLMEQRRSQRREGMSFHRDPRQHPGPQTVGSSQS
ncbi:MAG TPA: Spy/CpxP family protein refolding chaperone [Trichocoleus sp.]